MTTSMTEAQKIALARAVRLLTASGAQFAVIEPDGTKHGDLEIAVAKPRSLPPRLSEKYEWHPAFDAIKPGESFVFETESEEDGRRLSKNFASRAGQLWGNGSYIVATKGKTAELLRL